MPCTYEGKPKGAAGNGLATSVFSAERDICLHSAYASRHTTVTEYRVMYHGHAAITVLERLIATP